MLWMESIDEYHELRVNTVDSEMNVISAGDVWSSVAATNPVDGTQDMYIVKHGPSGELIWQRQLGAVGSDIPNDVAVDSNDNIYVFGHTLAYDGVDFSGETISKSCGSPCSNPLWLLIKYDKDGNRQWIKQIDKTGTSASTSGHGRAMDIEGNAIYLAGWSAVDSVNQVEKYDLDGNLQATINLTPPTDSSFTTSHKPWINDLDATPNGVYVTVRRKGTRPPYTLSDRFIRSKLTKLDNNLTSEVWQTDITGDFGMYQVKGMPNGNIVTHIREEYSDPDHRFVNIYN